MKTFTSSKVVNLFTMVYGLFSATNGMSQDSRAKDTSASAAPVESRYLDPNDKGVELIKNEKYSEASQYYSDEIKKDESNRAAYFNRGVVNFRLNNEANACRDWSALLALGDTAAFKLLDKNCHGTMVIEEDTVTSVQYHKMWTVDKKDAKAVSTGINAITIADEMPEFPGGTDALVNYIEQHLKYPAAARSNHIQGRVYVNFIISRKGKILFPYVTHGIGKSCDQEAVRLIRNMPAWKPGKQKGQPVVVRYNIPVNFRL